MINSHLHIRLIVLRCIFKLLENQSHPCLCFVIGHWSDFIRCNGRRGCEHYLLNTAACHIAEAAASGFQLVVHASAYDWSLHKVTHRGALTSPASRIHRIGANQTIILVGQNRLEIKIYSVTENLLIWLENNDSVQFQELVALVLNCLTVAQCTESLIGGGDKSWVEFKELQE